MASLSISFVKCCLSWIFVTVLSKYLNYRSESRRTIWGERKKGRLPQIKVFPLICKVCPHFLINLLSLGYLAIDFAIQSSYLCQCKHNHLLQLYSFFFIHTFFSHLIFHLACRIIMWPDLYYNKLAISIVFLRREILQIISKVVVIKDSTIKHPK